MTFYVYNRYSFERLLSLSKPPREVDVFSSANFILDRSETKAVFHSELSKLMLHLGLHESNECFPEKPWLIGLINTAELNQLRSLTISVLGGPEHLKLHKSIACLGLATHLARSMHYLELNNLYFERRLAALFSKTLPCFEALENLLFTSCLFNAPITDLVHASSTFSILYLGLATCSFEPDIIRCRFPSSQDGKLAQKEGYFHVTNWAYNFSIKLVIHRAVVSALEKIPGMATSDAMMRRLPLKKTMITKHLNYAQQF